MYVTDKGVQAAFGTSARNGHNTCLNILIKEAEKRKDTLLTSKAIHKSVLNQMKKKTSRAISMALLAAIEGKQEGIVNLILDQGADVNYTKVSGMTSLMLASFPNM